jgi:hypothetical protein
VYYHIELMKPELKQVSVSDSSFPIYGKEIFYRLMGSKGFREYQVLFSYNSWESAMEEIKKLIADSKIAIALGSLKVFRGKPHNISFTGEGVCITMDISNNEKGLLFFQALDEITLKHQGIINLSKDSRASAELVSALFPSYQQFKQGINAFDVHHTFTSELSCRIGIT